MRRPLQPHLRACSDSASLEARDDDALMQLAAAGVNIAFEVLVRRHHAALRAYCARLCGSGVGDEIAQEVLVSIWRLRATYRAGGQFRAYLFTIANHRCQNARRTWARSSQNADAGRLDPSVQGPLDASQLDALIARERQRLLQQRVAQLSPEQQQAIQLHFTAGLDYAEIAAICQRPAETIRSRVFLALKRLRTLTQKQGELP